MVDVMTLEPPTSAPPADTTHVAVSWFSSHRLDIVLDIEVSKKTSYEEVVLHVNTTGEERGKEGRGLTNRGAC